MSGHESCERTDSAKDSNESLRGIFKKSVVAQKSDDENSNKTLSSDRFFSHDEISLIVSDHLIPTNGNPYEDTSSQEDVIYDERKDRKQKAESKMKKSRSKKSVMEDIDLCNEPPRMEILVEKRKEKWDYMDPTVIRAMFVEWKTNFLKEWRVRNPKIKYSAEPTIRIRDNSTWQLRREHAQHLQELKHIECKGLRDSFGQTPVFNPIEIATTKPAAMRYALQINNPIVPNH